MQSFLRHRGIACAMPQADIDTDQIVPARFLHRARGEGYGDILFNDLRTRQDGSPDPDFALNVPPNDRATILIAGENFGCGSSREHAVWALVDFGFRAVIAPSFGDIFYSNALQNGLLVIRLAHERVGALLAAADPPSVLELAIDLEAQTVSGPDLAEHFEISTYHKEALMLGLSEMQMTLRQIDAIRTFEAYQAKVEPWLHAVPRLPSADNSIPGGSNHG